jgi:hypothetical protein
MSCKNPPLPTVYEFSCRYKDRVDKTEVNEQIRWETEGDKVTSIYCVEKQNERCFYGNSTDKHCTISWCLAGNSCKFLVINKLGEKK